MLFIGHTWEKTRDLTPAVITAVHQKVTLRYKLLRVKMPPTHWAISYVEQAGFLYRTDDEWKTRPADLFHLYSPEMVFWEDGTPFISTSLHNSYLIFTGGQELGLHRLIKPRRDYAEILDPSGQLKQLMFDAAAAGQRFGDEAFPKAQSILWQIADLLTSCKRISANRLCTDVHLSESLESPIVTAVDAYLLQNLAQRITIEDLARHLSLSASAISHNYKKAKGQSPIASLIAMRIQAAKGLLLRGESLKNIASRTGFRDAFHLSHTFKQSVGVSPKDYLKSFSQAEESS